MSRLQKKYLQPAAISKLITLVKISVYICIHMYICKYSDRRALTQELYISVFE